MKKSQIRQRLVMKMLDTSHIEQFNELLRYAFQVTDSDLLFTGWSDDSIKRSKYPILQHAKVLGWFDKGQDSRRDSKNLQNNIESNLQDSKQNLDFTESRFYTNNEFTNLDSKKLQNLDSNLQGNSPKNFACNHISHPPTLTENTSETFGRISHEQITDSTNKDSIKLANLESKTQNLDSKKQSQLEDSKLISQAVNIACEARNRFPARFVVRKIGKKATAVSPPIFRKKRTSGALPL